MSLQNTIGQLCVARRSKNHDLPLYVYQHKAGGYVGTENCTNNQNYKVMVKVNNKLETITYSGSIETANEVAKAVKVMQKLHKAELKAKLAQQKAMLLGR